MVDTTCKLVTLKSATTTVVGLIDAIITFLDEQGVPADVSTAMHKLTLPAIASFAEFAVDPSREWISVEDRLPDDNIAVLVYMPGVSEPVWMGIHFDGMWASFDGGGLGADVTHWAELPEPPKESADV